MTAVEKLISTIYAHPDLSRAQKDELFDLAENAMIETMRDTRDRHCPSNN
jgi:hypothetical protein